MTLALSTYYRTSLNRGETMTTVAKEIDNIRAYLKIQLVMHDNEFRVVEQISDGLNDYLIEVDPAATCRKMQSIMELMCQRMRIRRCG